MSCENGHFHKWVEFPHVETIIHHLLGRDGGTKLISVGSIEPLYGLMRPCNLICPSQTGRERSCRVKISLLTLLWGLTSSSISVGVTCGSGWPAMFFLNFPPECLFIWVSLHIAGETFRRVHHQTEGLHMWGHMNHGEIPVWRCTANTVWHVFCLPGSPAHSTQL